MPEEVRIVVGRNGPYRLFGPARVIDAEGDEYATPEGEWVHLCRLVPSLGNGSAISLRVRDGDHNVQLH
jgi:hypothetical protein